MWRPTPPPNSPCASRTTPSPESLFQEYGVNRGLRDANGVGVLTGLTNISKIVSFQNVGGKRMPCEGQLWYRGYNIKDLIGGLGPQEFGFEKIAYLLVFGQMPTPEELAEFTAVLADCRTLPTNFTRDVIMKAPSRDIMNSMTRSVLTLANYDDQVQRRPGQLHPAMYPADLGVSHAGGVRLPRLQPL